MSHTKCRNVTHGVGSRHDGAGKVREDMVSGKRLGRVVPLEMSLVQKGYSPGPGDGVSSRWVEYPTRSVPQDRPEAPLKKGEGWTSSYLKGKEASLTFPPKLVTRRPTDGRVIFLKTI